jgi:hypothetical protein
MKPLFVFLTAVFLAASSALPALTADTDYGTKLNVVNIYDPTTLQGKFFNIQVNPVWSPDGKTVAFSGGQQNYIYTVTATGGEPTLIYDNTGKQKGYVWKGVNIGGGGMVPLGFTPDGKEMDFAGLNSLWPNSGPDAPIAAETCPLIFTTRALNASAEANRSFGSYARAAFTPDSSSGEM